MLTPAAAARRAVSRVAALPPVRGLFARAQALHAPAAVLVDTGAFAAAFTLAFLGRLEQWSITDALQRRDFLPLLALFVGIETAAAFAFSLHRMRWRYAGVWELFTVAAAASLAAVGLTGLHAAYRFLPSWQIVPFNWAFAVVLAGGARMVVRRMRETALAGDAERQPALIIGAGDAGEQLLREARAHPEAGLEVQAFVDDDARLAGTSIHGVPIRGTTEDVAAIAARTGAKLALLALPSASALERRAIVQRIHDAGLAVKTVPTLEQLVGNKVSLSQVRAVEIEDLLPRAPLDVDIAKIGSKIAGKGVLVTGAAGSIGSELCRQVAALRPRILLAVDQNESGLFYLERELREKFPDMGSRLVPVLGDITQEAAMTTTFSAFHPEIVFHAAAYKHVPLAEKNEQEAMRNNVGGTIVIARVAEACGVETMLFISTDKAAAPAGVLGLSKLLAERHLQAVASSGSKTRFVSVRFGNVLGSVGSVVPIFQEQIRRGGPVTITHPDMKRFLMTIPEAVKLVMQAAAFGKSGSIYALDMGQPVKILDLARDLIRLSGLRPGEDIDIVFTGVRPGEKLEERLQSDEEVLLDTAHPRIKMIQPARDASFGFAEAA